MKIKPIKTINLTSGVILIGLILFNSIFFLSCEKYLDAKPDKSQVVPASLQDCQALLNNTSTLTGGDPVQGEISSDDYTLTFPIWNALISNNKEMYIWKQDANPTDGFSIPYQYVLVANQVLETLNKITPSEAEKAQWNAVKGSALFLRSFCFYNLAQVFAQPYDVTNATNNLGIPLRLTPSISEKSDRGNLQETYSRIIQDLREASQLLPGSAPTSKASKTTSAPVKAAAFALLARVYLVMGDYQNAFINANSSLEQYKLLMNYNVFPQNTRFPIPEYNEEVIYHAFGSGQVPLSSGRVNMELYNLYSASGDLRKKVCFQGLADGSFRYTGYYSRGSVFTGLSTNEMYLVRAECFARAGNVNNAMKDLNDLLTTRWAIDPATGKSSYINQSATDSNDALKKILNERRKELPFRGLRWSDLRRLNKESQFAVSISRTLNGQTYTLPPNDLRYTLLIPNEIINSSNLKQNPR